MSSGPGLAASRTGFAHIPALDGIRAVALIAVLLFHAGHANGAFLSVDLFFVLSGYLITSLLLTEWARTGTVDLKRFWSRRLRRLLPAALVLLAATAAYAAFVLDPTELARFRGDALAAVLDVANWRSIQAGSDYWESFGPPSPLRHMWTLSVEEQLYVLWPAVAYLALRIGRARGWGRDAVLVAALCLAALSMALMAGLVREGDTARAYYGTDTRASGVLVGAVAAILLSGRVWAPAAAVPRALAAATPVALVVLAVGWAKADGQDVAMYRGGFQVCVVAAAVVVAAVATGGPAWLVRLLSPAPLRWLGRVSYGAYLWHWPIFVAVDEDVVAARWVRTGVRFALTLVFAALSSRLVERPVRDGAVSTRVWRVAGPVGVLAVAGATLLATSDAESRPASGSVVAGAGGAGAQDVLLMGDSEAFELSEGADAVADELSVTTLSFFGCGIGPGLAAGATIVISNDGRGTSCPDVADRFVEAVAAEDPDLVLLHVAGFELFDRKVGDRIVAFGSEEWDDLTGAALVDTLSGLRAGDRRVVALAAPCFDPRLLDDGTLQIVTREQAEEIIAIRGDDRRVERWNELLREAAIATGVEVLPYDSLFCGVPEADQPSRPDGVHLDDDGARAVWRWLLPRLRDA